MPIRPEMRGLYPKNWREISERIRFRRAGDRCECRGECGHEHFGEDTGDRCEVWNGEPHPETGSMVVLTVAHLDHEPQNCSDDNLKAMCQRCRLAYDREHHRQTRRRRRAIRDLFEEITP